ncbi:Helix-turn-helix domain-containing protein [Soonwooa buanensis]|uniref:Helix-turn-helix domain-containing protein n=1 Tax=Soonwooa buanensis TaxID=619805 RepID=A0A1T5FIR3_9FLAO|nr:helix-turn-helix domain-containing protein [Soonwooa buanensis]SKB96061.1 Helix-turn-helix domain-containing protein [Soonwooa buanensis]
MKPKFSFSEGDYMNLHHIAEDLLISSLEKGVAIQKSMLLSEDDVCQILQISPRTLRKYRSEHFFRFIKLHGRIYFLKLTFYLDLLKLNEDSLEY